MGLLGRVARKSVRAATPRSVRRAMHPVRTAKNSLTPRSVRQVSRAIYTVTNPLGAAENALIGSILYSGRTHSTGSTRSKSGRQTKVSGTGLRADQAAESINLVGSLMSVGRERFAPAKRTVVPKPERADVEFYFKRQWMERKQNSRIWQRKFRLQLREEARKAAEIEVEQKYQKDLKEVARKQAELDRWWQGLCRGDSEIVKQALVKAFSDNPAPLWVISAASAEADLVLCLPDDDVLPEKKAHVTPTGRLSSKLWTKSEFSELYADLLGAHLLATIRETWAVAPSLARLHILGLREVEEFSPGHRVSVEVLFEQMVFRESRDWSNDKAGTFELEMSPTGLFRVGKARTIAAWPPESINPEVRKRLAKIGKHLAE